MDYQEFISGSKTKLIALAGYGKTFTIAECLKHTKGKQLILTHTHAGVASIKEKIAKNTNIKPSSYNVETISSFAQRYVVNLYNGNDFPEQKDTANYYPFIITKATELFSLNNVQDIIKASYNGLFVDEYQDCTKSQHIMLMKLADILPTHILGDPLQGIFYFREELVDFDSDLNDFSMHPKLDTPWRWNNAGCQSLGEALKDIRKCLLETKSVNFDNYKIIKTIIAPDTDKYIFKTSYNQKIWSLVNRADTSSILIIEPISSSIKIRKDFTTRFKNIFRVIESIDDKDFDNLAEELDKMIKSFDFINFRKECLEFLFTQTGVNEWFNDKGTKEKTKASDAQSVDETKKLIEILKIDPAPFIIRKILIELKDTLQCKYYRKELLSSTLKALEQASLQKTSVAEAMIQNRNNIRRIGRKIHGKCIGTTLLTKGLEFDTVVVLDAHKFKDAKNLYVALTRCCKELIVFTNNTEIKFNV